MSNLNQSARGISPKCWTISSTMVLVMVVWLAISVHGQDGRGAGLRPISSLPSKETRWALIIGVDSYAKDISPLYGSVNDAKALKEILIKHAGFPEPQVILMTTDTTDVDLLPNRGDS